jgi:hypothetical protein
MTASAGWESEAGHSLLVSYRYNRDPGSIFESFLGRGDVFDAPDEPDEKVNQLDVSLYVVASSRLELFAEGFTSLVSSGSDGGRVGVVLISGCKCWDIVTALEKQTRPDDTRFTVNVRLTGLGESGARPNSAQRRRFEALN